jgi:CDP-6-deoxy-D-xylo-4-hexulose-3-dehydrase
LFVESERIENRFNVQVDDIAYDAKFVFEALGYNLEPSEMGAAFGLVQLTKLNQNIALREKWFAQHNEFFEKYAEWFILPKQLPKSRTGWLAYALTVRDSAPFNRTQLQIFLEKRKIQTRTIFTGNILRQPGFKDIPCHRAPQGYEQADRVMRGGILLACHHGLTENMMAHLHESFTVFAREISHASG